MALPPEIKERMKKSGDVKVPLKDKGGDQAVIEGKTAVPFGTFVKLILKRKVQTLFKEWQQEPVILSSELLTKIASAPEDTHEDRSKIILTALVIGLCFGLFVTGAVIILFGLVGIEIGQREILTALGVLLFLACAVYGSMQVHAGKVKKGLVEKVEQVADVFSK